MDNKEVALELLKMYLQHHRGEISLEELVEAYLAIVEMLETPIPKEKSPDYSAPLSLSDKEA